MVGRGRIQCTFNLIKFNICIYKYIFINYLQMSSMNRKIPSRPGGTMTSET